MNEYAQFRKLYAENYGLLFYWLLGQSKNTETAQDVLSKAFALAWERRAQLNGNAKTWLWRIAINQMKEVWRRAHPAIPLDDILDRPDPRDFTEDLARFMEWQKAAQAVDRLEPRSRRAILYHVQGLSTQQAAKVQRVPPGTAGRRLFTAKKELKEKFTRSERLRELCAV